MAGEIRLQAETGFTIKALIVGDDGTVWSGSAMVATSSLTDANWTAALIACTEQATSDVTGTGLYLATWPGALMQTARYTVQFFTGASPTPGALVFAYQFDPTEYFAVDVTAVSGDTTAADNLELQYGGTGLSGSTFPATQSQVNNIGSGATGGTHVEATYDNTTTDTIDNAAAVDKGSGLVGIPVTGHAFVAGREVTIAGTTNYNGAFGVISQTTNEVVITDTFVGETFGGSETIVSSIKGEVFVGTITAGTFANVSAANGSLHSMDDVGDDINIVYGFNVGGSRQGTEVSIFANLDGNNDEIKVKVYDHVGDTFEDRKTLEGSGGSSFVPLKVSLLSKHTGTGTAIGDVFILFQTDSTTPSSLDVDECLLTAVSTNLLIGYPNGFEISAAGTSGTEYGVNGTAGNPCPFADALTMNAIHPLNLFAIHVGETITLTGSTEGIALMGVGWTLVLGGNSISGSSFDGANVSGIGTGATEPHFHHCHFADVTLPPSDCENCVLQGTFTFGTAGDFFFEHCESGVAGTSTPIIDFGAALNASNVTLQNYGGGIDIRNMGAGSGNYNMSLGGNGQLVINANCSATSTVAIRGNFTVTDNASGAVTLSDEARFDVAQVQSGLAVPGDQMNLADNAITSGKYDELTAFAVTSVDSDSTQIARTGADSDTLGTISDQIDGVPTTAEFEARTILAAAYFKPASDAVANVTLVGTTTTIAATGLDAIISRSAANVEDTAGVFSLAHSMLAFENSDVSTNAGKRTTFKSDGTTEFAQTDIASDPLADPITGVG